VLNKARRREDVWVGGGIAPRVLNTGARWRRVACFISRPLYSERARVIPFDRGAWWAPEQFWMRWQREKAPSPSL